MTSADIQAQFGAAMAAGFMSFDGYLGIGDPLTDANDYADLSNWTTE